MKIRLNKFLSSAGLCSRRKSDGLIQAGEIRVNGKVAVLGDSVDPEKDEVVYRKELVKMDSELVYFALYKPKGVITAASDDLGRKTVLDFMPKSPRVFPVGRLDYDSEGLLILTNDGELSQELSHPSFEHTKEYLVVVDKHLSKKDFSLMKSQFENGLLIDNLNMKADSITLVNKDEKNTSFKMELHTGYNRQIRKMCGKINLSIKKLVRTKVGKVRLSSLAIKPGQFCKLKKDDIL